MVKVSKVFLDDVLPSTGTATIADAMLDLATGLIHYGDNKVVHVSRVREMTVDIAEASKLSDSTFIAPSAPAPIVRKGPNRK